MENRSEQMFQNACKCYQQGKDLIADWLKLSSDEPSERTFLSAMTGYDFILQGILLHVALADGVFVPLEKLFIQNITEFNDILAGFKRKKSNDQQSLTWNTIDQLTEEEKMNCAKAVLSVLDEHVDAFLRCFARINANVPYRDFLRELNDSIFGIMLSLASIDKEGPAQNELVQSRYRAGRELYLDVVGKKWNALRGKE